MRSTTTSFTRDNYIPGNAWFICDRCSQRFRRSEMMTEWTGLKVDAKCLDPRPPQMTPPNIFPEGVPFVDARPPQDNSDRLQDDSSLLGGPGNQIVTIGQLVPGASPGSLTPQLIIGEPYVANAYTLADDYTIITGLVPAPTQNANNMPPQTNPLK